MERSKERTWRLKTEREREREREDARLKKGLFGALSACINAFLYTHKKREEQSQCSFPSPSQLLTQKVVLESQP